MLDEGLKWFFRTFSWSRGIIAAIVTLAVLESVFGWDRISFLELTHTIISHWNVVTDTMFGWVLQWIPIPSPGAYARNLVLLGFVALGPAIVFFFSDIPGRSWMMQTALVLGVAGYCGWVTIFWSLDMAIPDSANLIEKTLIVLMLVAYPLGFAQGAILGMEITEFGRKQTKAMIAMFFFLATLEALYHFPKVKIAAATYVAYVHSISEVAHRPEEDERP